MWPVPTTFKGKARFALPLNAGACAGEPKMVAPTCSWTFRGRARVDQEVSLSNSHEKGGD